MLLRRRTRKLLKAIKMLRELDSACRLERWDCTTGREREAVVRAIRRTAA